MADTFSTYEDWAPEPISDQTKRVFEKATEKLMLCMEYEEKLVYDMIIDAFKINLIYNNLFRFDETRMRNAQFAQNT